MGSIVIFVVGVAAMLGSLWLIASLWHTERPVPLGLTLETSVRSRLAATAQRTSGLLTAAVVAGLLVPGLGGRLMMRLLAATSPRSAQGRLTDAEEVVGRVTFGGTASLVLFIGLLGGLTSLGVFVLVRPWLPRRSVLAGLVSAAIGGGLFARPTGFIDPDNRDFVILSPVWLAMLCALIVIVVYGVLFAVLADAWAAGWPKADRSLKGLLSLAPGVAIFLVAAAAVAPAIAIVVLMGFTMFIRPRLHDAAIARFQPVGQVVVGAAAMVAAAWVLVSVVQVVQL